MNFFKKKFGKKPYGQLAKDENEPWESQEAPEVASTTDLYASPAVKAKKKKEEEPTITASRLQKVCSH